MQNGTIVIDTAALPPPPAPAKKATTLGATMLDAPVSGGEIGAINASLSIMVGGEQTAFDAVKPILDVIGNPDRVIRIGDSGAGQICKVCNQMVIGGTLVAVSEAFALARKAQVNVALVRDALLGGFAASKVLDVHGQRMLESNYKPGFRAKLFAKDLKIAISTLAENETAAPVSSVVQQLVTALLAEGRGEDHYSGRATVLCGLAGLKESK
jgi:2-hydroxy-3-oxopropionate reductase